jgi:putative NADH-flavin reductase
VGLPQRSRSSPRGRLVRCEGSHRRQVGRTRVVIAGGHGTIALPLHRRLTAHGDTPVGLIRNPAQAQTVRAAGATPVVYDLEHTTVADLATHLTHADAVISAAGAGPGSGAARKDTADRPAAALLDAPATTGATVELVAGPTPVTDAVRPATT